MLKRLCSIALIVTALALSPLPVAAQTLPPCRVLIQFYNEGSPGIPGVIGDGRYGIRLNVADVGNILFPANTEGYVYFYAQPDTVVPFTYARLYFGPLAEENGTAAEAGCGFTAIHVPAGN